MPKKKKVIPLLAVAQRESFSKTVQRALIFAQQHYPQVLKKYRLSLKNDLSEGDILKIFSELLKQYAVVLVIDEFGKILEHAAAQDSDLHLVQQLSELSCGKTLFYFYALLHANFTEYGKNLSALERSTWEKVQGRFEDIPFVEDRNTLISLIIQSFTHHEKAKTYAQKVAKAWENYFFDIKDFLPKLFPLHPITALVLPKLCMVLGQNERSLFNYLCSQELNSFAQFLEKEVKSEIELLRVFNLYEYFLEQAQLATLDRLPRILEIRERVSRFAHLGSPYLEILKTVAVLNALPANTFKASRQNVLLALSHLPEKPEKEYEKALEELVEKGILLYRKSIDELLLWEGSEVNLEELINKEIEKLPAILSPLANEKIQLSPFVASKHSFRTGNLRFFATLFYEPNTTLTLPNADGYIFIDISEKKEKNIKENKDGYPVLYVYPKDSKKIRSLLKEVLALLSLNESASLALLDAACRREIKDRKEQLENRLLEFTTQELYKAIAQKSFESFPKILDKNLNLSQILSLLCDRAYSANFILRNELINRRELTSQMAMARRKVALLWIQHREKAQDYLKGDGPEVSIFQSLVDEKNIEGLKCAFLAMANFTQNAQNPRPIKELYEILQKPPYGIRQEVIPLLLLKYILEKEHRIFLYENGSFVKEITIETFDLLCRKPQNFTIKEIKLSLQEEKYIATFLENFGVNEKSISLIQAIRPLLKFLKSLPKYSLETQNLSEPTKKLRKILLEATEPDKLLFFDIPQVFALSLEKPQKISQQLQKSLSELESVYYRLLESVKEALKVHLRVPETVDMIAYLRTIGALLAKQVLEPKLRAFLFALSENYEEIKWLENVASVVRDKAIFSWNDQDLAIFESYLQKLATSFLNLHQLKAKMVAKENRAFEARLVSITKENGQEFREVVWIYKDKKDKLHELDKKIWDILEQENFSLNEKQMLLTGILEKLLEQKSEIPLNKEEGRNMHIKIERNYEKA